MNSRTSSLMGRNRKSPHFRMPFEGRCRNRFLPVAMVAILIVATMIPLVSMSEDIDSVGGETHIVVYHSFRPGSNPVSDLKGYESEYNTDTTTDERTKSVTYQGSIVSTEYNPQVWEFGEKWFEITVKGYENGVKYYDKTGIPTYVFTGWVYATGFDADGNPTGYTDNRYPGEVMSAAEMDAASYGGSIHVYATWDTLYDVRYVDGYRGSYNDPTDNGESQKKATDLYWVFHDYNSPKVDAIGTADSNGVYRSIVLICNEEGNHSIESWDVTKPVTIRGMPGHDNVVYDGIMSLDDKDTTADDEKLRWNFNADAIVDNVRIEGHITSNHGDSNEGIHANGNVLVIGTGVESVASNQNGNNADSWAYTQIFGASPGEGIAATRTPYGSSEDSNFGSFVIVHSGTFSNIVGGAYQDGATVGTSDVRRSVYLVVKDVVLLDTLQGGSPKNNSKTYGDVYVYVVGAYMPGDTYEESFLGTQRLPSNLILEESTILTGGGNNGILYGDTYVYISGESELWDVQGAGRRGSSTVNDSHVEVSGNAIVKHMVCGSITDGNYSVNRKCVDNTHIVVKDEAVVASVFGAGYDTYYSPTSTSMYGSSSITVEITGGTVGYVYGGGYRGDVGTENAPIGSISVRISGGTILGDVFGGGRGGLDKILHNSDGSFGSGSAYPDSTGNSNVYAKSVSVSVTGGTVKGSVYGGGESTPVITKYGNESLSDSVRSKVASVVAESVSVSVTGGTVIGDVFGAGKGVDLADVGTFGGTTAHSSAFIFSLKETNGVWEIVRIPWIKGENADLAKDSYTGYAAMDACPSGNLVVSVTVGSELSRTTVGGSVYGAGELGILGVENGDDVSVSVSLTGTGTTIGGDVFAGGYGEMGKLSSYTVSRTVTINGPTINGSVYGGSRDGNDNCLSAADGTINTGSYTKGSATIRVVSGTILAGQSGNVYGAGYRGLSYMDTKVLVGIPASEDSNLKPISDRLWINSVYGGSSIGESSDSYNNAKLLKGDTTVEIGGAVSDYPGGIRVSGDVFGKGDYCDIDGTATVTIDGFIPDASVLSIQKADAVTITDSQFTLDGNLDGRSSAGSAKFSLNDIGNLELASIDSRTVITINAQTAALSGLQSIYKGNIPNKDAEGVLEMNSIVINGGVILSILGDGNDGSASGTISGTLYIQKGDNDYYGAFAIGVTSWVSTDTHMVVLDNGVYRDADVSQYSYNGIGLIAWHLSGVYVVEDTVVLESEAETGTISVESDVGVPKFVAGSQLVYAGKYVVHNSKGSLDLVGDLDGSDPGTDFHMVVGIGGGGLTFNKGVGIDLANDSGDYRSTNTGLSLRYSVETLDGFDHTGYVGTVTLHFAEEYGGIVVGTFDVSISIYLRVKNADGLELENDLLLKEDNGVHKGTAQVYLPVIPNNTVAQYRIVSVDGGNGPIPERGTLTVDTVSTNLNKSGWMSHLSDPMDLSKWGDGSDGYLGQAAVYAPVLEFFFECKGGDHDVDGKPMTIVVEATTDDKTFTYTIVLNPKIAETVTVSFYDKYLMDNGTTQSWSEYTIIFSVGVQFGDKLSEYYVALDTSIENYKLNDADTYMTGFDGCLYKTNGVVAAGSLDSIVSAIGGRHVSDDLYETDSGNYYVLPLTKDGLLAKYLELKPVTAYGNGKSFNYSKSNPNWYDSDKAYSRYNFESLVTEDSVGLYSNFGISITIVTLVMDGTSVGSIEGVSVSPSIYYVSTPGTEVTLSKLQESLSLTVGYEVYGWYSQAGNKLGDTIKPVVNEKICVYVKLVAYDLKITVHDRDNSDGTLYQGEIVENGGAPSGSSINGEFTIGFKKLSDGNLEDIGDGIIHYGDVLTITLTYANGTVMRVQSVDGTMSNGSVVSGITFENSTGEPVTSTVTLTMEAGDTSLHIYLTSKNTVVLRISDEGDGQKFTWDNGNLAKSESVGSRVQTIELDFDKDVTSTSFKVGTYNSNSVSVNVYCDGSQVITGISDNSVSLDVPEGITTYDVVVFVEWKLHFQDGYDVIRNNEVLQSDVSTVHTGDVLTISLDEDYGIDSSFTHSGVEPTDLSNKIFMVSGEGDVSFGPAVLLSVSIQVTIQNHSDVPAGTQFSICYVIGGSVQSTGSIEWTTGSQQIKVPTFQSIQLYVVMEGYESSTETLVSSGSGYSATLHIAKSTEDEGSSWPSVEETVLYGILHTGSDDIQLYEEGGGPAYVDAETTVTIGGTEYNLEIANGFLKGLPTFTGRMTVQFGDGLTVHLTSYADAAGAPGVS